jgi:hypothetical protein
MTAFLENHIFAVQISLFLFILLTFWFLEIFFVEQKSKDKILHSFVNAKFLSLVIPVQIGLSVILLSVSARTETENFGLLNHLPIHKNGVAFYLIALVLLDF